VAGDHTEDRLQTLTQTQCQHTQCLCVQTLCEYTETESSSSNQIRNRQGKADGLVGDGSPRRHCTVVSVTYGRWRCMWRCAQLLW
jgi:hypothetical protein